MKLQYLTLILANVLLIYCHEPITDTTHGKVKGIVKESAGKTFTAFYGIPFAAAPTGNLRFKPPQSHPGWSDTIFDARQTGNACPQMPDVDWEAPLFPERISAFTEDEDCLFLNIFIPGELTSDRKVLLPVTVFIHGGGMVVGSADMYFGDVITTFAEPMLAVSIQYRLGTLGFLTSGDDVLSGNLGLKDQSFALRWVRENIISFGGDPDKITICGESAGGESVLAHMISPMSAGLFQKASAQSSPEAWIYPKKETFASYFKNFSAALDCEGDTEQALECLQTKPWQDIVSLSEIPMPALSQRVIDGEFITDEPKTLWATGKYNKAELMIGFTSADGDVLIDYFFNPEFINDRSSDAEVMDGLIYALLLMQLADDEMDYELIRRHGKTLANYEALHTMIKARYYDSQSGNLNKAMGILNCATDNYMVIFSLFVANQMAKNGDSVHMYFFDHRSNEYPSSDLPLGAPHGSELPFQFGYGFSNPDEAPMTEEESQLSRSLMHAWTTFAKGQPFYLSMDSKSLEWPSYTTDSRNILVFDTSMSSSSVIDAAEIWQPVLDFWLAIESLAVFQEQPLSDVGEKDGKENNEKEEL